MKMPVNRKTEKVFQKSKNKDDQLNTQTVSRKTKIDKQKRRTRRIRVVAAILILLVILYWVLIYFVVSAALVPSFMSKLDAFEEITEISYAQMVQTDDIHTNEKEALADTKEWFQTVEKQKVELINKDGFRLIACEFFPDTAASHRWALLLHGYTGWKEELYPIGCWYQRVGYHVLVPDLRCQGESEGDFIGLGWIDHYDCLEWIDYILQQDPEAEIVLHGQSMGAATALILSGDKNLPEQVKAVVSDSAYTDGYSMFADKAKEWMNLPAFPIVDSARLMLLLRGGYDLKDASPLDAVAKSHTPTLLIHGDKDRMIPVESAYILYDAATCPKELLIVEGAGHVQANYKDPEGYYGTVEEFLEQYM